MRHIDKGGGRCSASHEGDDLIRPFTHGLLPGYGVKLSTRDSLRIYRRHAVVFHCGGVRRLRLGVLVNRRNKSLSSPNVILW